MNKPKEYIECSKCKEMIEKKEISNNLYICPFCKKYFNLSINDRLKQLADEEKFFEKIGTEIYNDNALSYLGYKEKLNSLRSLTKLNEAIECGICHINGNKIVLAIMDSNFFMGSFGKCVGERLTVAIEKATEDELPLVVLSASSGARMQEEVISLMQMVKITQALSKHNEKGLLYISVLTNPTMGGAIASFASLGDVILAEPNAIIGFTGKRVIQQTINQELPNDFQTSEFLLNHGFIDKIVERKDLKNVIGLILNLHSKGVINE